MCESSLGNLLTGLWFHFSLLSFCITFVQAMLRYVQDHGCLSLYLSELCLKISSDLLNVSSPALSALRMSEREESPPRVVIERSLPYRWNAEQGWIVIPDHPEAERAYAVLGRQHNNALRWRRIVSSLFAIRQLQQWFSSSGQALQQINPSIRDRVARRLGR